MIIVFASLLIPVGLMLWALCKSTSKDPRKDEEQERYLAEWERRHRK